ncbi:MAG: lipopolysaccharide heptosyltransferase II [Lentisphaeria bacterium]|nr:lipopolysaccharide heptosyltransferase II [Lentisphaeria bacterium]
MSERPVHFLDIRRDFPSPQFEAIPPGRDMWRNGMVVRMPNHLGDAVMALPALGQLRKIVPANCALFCIAPAGQRALYHALPIVDGMLGLAEVHRAWSREEFMALRRQRFGVGVLFNNSFRDALTMRLAGVSNLYGAKARCRSLLLRRAFAFPPRPDHEPANIHHANRYLAIASALGAPAWDGTLPEFRLTPDADELPPTVTALCEHPKLLTIASGAAYGAAKRWPSGNFREIAAHWIETGGIVAVLGSESERGIGDEVVAGLDARKAYNLSGQTSLIELMHLLRSSAMTVANDSGIMHLSAALGRPGVAVFGPTDYTATGPIGANWRLLYEKQECSPCFRRECRYGLQRCIRAITPAMVISEMDAMAGEGTGPVRRSRGN